VLFPQPPRIAAPPTRCASSAKARSYWTIVKQIFQTNDYES
jgi:hypothetical protein